MRVSKTAVETAVETAREFDRLNRSVFPRLCLKFVRTCWGVPMKFPTAIAAWHGAQFKHPWTGDTEDIPYGAPVFFMNPRDSDSAGHVVITAGHDRKGRRNFKSNDIIASGHIDTVHIDAFTERWGLEVLGWTEDLNGVKLRLPKSPNQRKRAKRK
jgi:hypothetical protein